MTSVALTPLQEVEDLLAYIACATRHPRPLPSVPHAYSTYGYPEKEMGDLYNCLYKLYTEVDVSMNFREPVNALEFHIFDYYDRVPQPMSIHDVLDRMASGKVYTSVMQVEADIELIWKNAATFNGPQHPITQTADQCRELLARLRDEMPASGEEVSRVFEEMLTCGGDAVDELRTLLEQWPELLTEDWELKTEAVQVKHFKRILELRNRFVRKA